jgi:hypothetical protein
LIEVWRVTGLFKIALFEWVDGFAVIKMPRSPTQLFDDSVARTPRLQKPPS